MYGALVVHNYRSLKLYLELNTTVYPMGNYTGAITAYSESETA